MKIICKDGHFPVKTMEQFDLQKINPPHEGISYTPRAIVRDTKGNVGVLLNELKNPSFQTGKEVAFDIQRFTSENGESICWDNVIHHLLNS